MTRTLQTVCRHVHHFGTGQAEAQNVWILAAQSPLSLGTAAPEDRSEGPILTDDRAPAEFLIGLDLLRERGL